MNLTHTGNNPTKFVWPEFCTGYQYGQGTFQKNRGLAYSKYTHPAQWYISDSDDIYWELHSYLIRLAEDKNFYTKHEIKNYV